MSLRRYLFALIGGLIIILSASQYFLVTWIENSLQAEVSSKARHMSEQVIELAIKELDKSSAQINVIEQQVSVAKDGVNHEIEVVVQPENSAHIFIEKHSSSHSGQGQAPLAIKEFKSIVKKIYEKEAFTKTNDSKEKTKERGNSQQWLIANKPTSVVTHQWVSNGETHSTTQALIEKIQWVIILGALLGLIIAYWLSARFNKPLSTLINGFKQVANGDYSHHIEPQGVKEISATIEQFNAMTRQIQTLTQAEQQLAEVNHLAELGDVSRGLAHALRNPIHTIGLSIEQLIAQDLSHENRERLAKTIQNKITHIDKNIKALLTLTSSGIQRNEDVPLLAVVQDIILEYKSCQQKSIRFEVNVNSATTLRAAESEIRNIIHTLIINACDASPENGLVNVAAFIDNKQQVHLSISDSGKGIDKTIQSQLFQPHISTKPEGAGMGLYIAKRITTLHYQGDLTLTNVIDEQEKIIGCRAKVIFNTREEKH